MGLQCTVRNPDRDGSWVLAHDLVRGAQNRDSGDSMGSPNPSKDRYSWFMGPRGRFVISGGSRGIYATALKLRPRCRRQWFSRPMSVSEQMKRRAQKAEQSQPNHSKHVIIAPRMELTPVSHGHDCNERTNFNSAGPTPRLVGGKYLSSGTYLWHCNGKHAALSMHSHIATLWSKLRRRNARLMHSNSGAPRRWFSYRHVMFECVKQVPFRGIRIYRRMQFRSHASFFNQLNAFHIDGLTHTKLFGSSMHY